MQFEPRYCGKNRQEGLIDGILLALKKLMKNKGMSVEEAFTTLGVPEADWQEYRKPLAGQ